MVLQTFDVELSLASYLEEAVYDRIFVLTDENTRRHCLPVIQAVLDRYQAKVITIKPDDVNKDIRQVIGIWEELSKSGASRNSLLINLGGGMITDLGGFAGATFKRGLHNLNIPTTLMGAVDAAVGGKTGINFAGLKNEVGSFYQPDGVILDSRFLKTLDRNNILSGYAEMLKHALISDKETYYKTIVYDIEHPNFDVLNDLISISVAIKERIVVTDPKERGIRKALNFGHTIGHALESLSFGKGTPVLHGIAVAAGLVCELYLSHKIANLPVEFLRLTTNFIREHYPTVIIGCKDYEAIHEFMLHDKKNESDRINFTLLADVGEVRINQTADTALLKEAIDFYRENSC
jgi:3-dehydroquinate synthase